MKVKKIATCLLSPFDLYFQYEPESFLREFYPGDEATMLRIENTPHYKFLKLYQEIGKDIWNVYNDTDYIKMMIKWGRDDKHNKWKVARFLDTYNDIKKNGLRDTVSVLKDPMHRKSYVNGYEIFHGHHRSAVCCALNYKEISCTICKVLKH